MPWFISYACNDNPSTCEWAAGATCPREEHNLWQWKFAQWLVAIRSLLYLGYNSQTLRLASSRTLDLSCAGAKLSQHVKYVLRKPCRKLMQLPYRQDGSFCYKLTSSSKGRGKDIHLRITECDIGRCKGMARHIMLVDGAPTSHDINHGQWPKGLKKGHFEMDVVKNNKIKNDPRIPREWYTPAMHLGHDR
jgi:hypothetical protein